MKRICASISAAVFVLLLLPLAAAAQISVDRVIVNFKKGELPVRNVVVTNGGKEPLYVTAVSDVMVKPGTAEEARQPTEDLVVSPKRFSVEPGGQRTVRLLLKRKLGDEEQVYRVKFLPQGSEFDAQEMADSGKGRKTQLKVLFSVGMLIFAEPLEIQPKLEWKREGNEVVFRNTGNVNVMLEDVKLCKSADAECSEHPSNRLYPGNEWKVQAPSALHVQMRKQVGDAYESLVIPPAA